MELVQNCFQLGSFIVVVLSMQRVNHVFFIYPLVYFLILVSLTDLVMSDISLLNFDVLLVNTIVGNVPDSTWTFFVVYFFFFSTVCLITYVDTFIICYLCEAKF
jgi:hypothetical protein